jgi:predicted amidohydrolase
MKIAGIQLDIAWEDPEESFRRAEPMVRKAAAAGARLVVLPEMFATGFTMDVPVAAAAAPGAEAFLRDMAKGLGIFLLAGVADGGGAGGKGRNFALVFGPDGAELCRYQKIHPFTYGGEAEKYEEGDRLASFSCEGLRVVPLICYDLRFPELFRAAAARADLIAVVASWPSLRRLAWRTLLQARAMDSQGFVLGVNRCGEGGGLHFSGDSLLADPSGGILAEAAEGQGLVLGEVSAEEVAAVRARFPFLKDRRPEIYRKIS